MEPIIEPILLIEKQFETVNLLIEKEELIQDIIIERPADIIPDIINPNLIAQAEELRKLILLQETIKRYSKKRLLKGDTLLEVFQNYFSFVLVH